LLLDYPKRFNYAHFYGQPPLRGGRMQKLTFHHPSHLDHFGTHVAVCDQLFIYSTVNIVIICK